MNQIKTYTIEDVDRLFDAAYEEDVVKKNDEGRIVILQMEITPTPWHFSNHAHKEGCAFWNSVITWPCFGKGNSFIPLACLNCWKVVIRPRTVKELFTLRDIIEELKMKSKCGIETRGTVGAMYGGYFYNESLEEGKGRNKFLRFLLGEYLFTDLTQEEIEGRVFLKRGCTEYELGHGDSKDWKPFDGQEEVEKHIVELIDVIDVNTIQSEKSRRHTYEWWKRWAYTAGDMTYKEFNNGEDLYPPYRKY